MKRIDRLWYSRNPVVWLLLPLALLFCAVAVSRRWLYLGNLLQRYTVDVPVVVVGNITVGGTGKTPLIIALCSLLREEGLHPGVISRGYGSTVDGVHEVTAEGSAQACGDEPLLIRQRGGCPVVTGRDRVAAARTLLERHDCDLILSDDGLQHYRLERDIEIAVIDKRRGFGNGFCLPAGPLRERAARLKAVDLVVYSGTEEKRFSFTLRMQRAVNLANGERRPVSEFSGQHVHAVAGIGDPERFFHQLQTAGLQVIPHAFPDHHAFSAGDIRFNDAAVLLTEKDAVKCAPLVQSAGFDNVWSVPVDAVLSPDLRSAVLAKLRQLRVEEAG